MLIKLDNKSVCIIKRVWLTDFCKRAQNGKLTETIVGAILRELLVLRIVKTGVTKTFMASNSFKIHFKPL